MRKSLFIALLVAAGQVAAQSPGKKSKPLVLFSIKNSPVYVDEFVYLYRKNHLNQEDFTEKKVAEYLDLFVNFKLKVAEAKSRGLDTTSTFNKEFKSYKDELRKPYLAEKDELERLTKEVYQRLSEEVKASHILIMLNPDATPADTLAALKKIGEIRSRIMDGESFEKMAKENSEDPSAKSTGGNLGYFTAMQMVYQFEQAAYSLKVGEVSQPIRTRFGYHLVKLTDRKPARGEVEVSHIILRTGSPDDKKVKNKIYEIYDQLRGGRGWEELCKEFSEDPATKDMGGKLRPFGVGALAGVPEFETVAFSLKTSGEISDPFQSAYGWHIVRLERRIPVPAYAQVEEALKRKVARDERLQIADKRQLEERKKQYGFSENTEMKKVLMDAADSNLLKGKWKFPGESSQKAKTIFSFQDKNYTAGQLIEYVEKNQTTSSMNSQHYMKQLYNSFLEESLTGLEDKKLIAENSDFRNLLTEYQEGILLFTIMEKEVWNKDAEDTVVLRKFYRENKEKYKAGDRVHARVFMTADKKFLEDVKKRIDAGDSLKKDDLKKFKSILPFRSYERGENKAVDKVSWAIGLHLAEENENFFLVEIDNLIPPGAKYFEESRAQVVSDYQEIAEKKWLKELREKYPVKINNKGKKFVTSELTKK